jgi:hypothetical protein
MFVQPEQHLTSLTRSVQAPPTLGQCCTVVATAVLGNQRHAITRIIGPFMCGIPTISTQAALQEHKCLKMVSRLHCIWLSLLFLVREVERAQNMCQEHGNSLTLFARVNFSRHLAHKYTPTLTHVHTHLFLSHLTSFLLFRQALAPFNNIHTNQP